MAAASYEEILEAIGSTLRQVDGIGKVADLDEEVGPRWERQAKANQAYWEVSLTREEQVGKSGAGRQTLEMAVFAVNGYMPQHPAYRSTRFWLALVKRVTAALRSDPTFGGVVASSRLPQIVRNEVGTAMWGDQGREFGCHHVLIEVTVEQFVASP